MTRFLKLQWKTDNIDEDNNTYYRIDFNTPTLTIDSEYRIFHARYIPHEGSAGIASNVPDDSWYSSALVSPGPKLVRRNRRFLLNFIRNHSGTSDEYIQASDILNRILGCGVGAADVATEIIDNGVKRRKRKSKKRQSKSKRKSKRKSKKKSRCKK